MIPLGSIVKVSFGSGEVKCVGLAESYLGEPSYEIKDRDGHTFHWPASLVTRATAEEEKRWFQERIWSLEAEVRNLKIQRDETTF